MSNETPVKWSFGVVDKLTAPLRKMSTAFQPMMKAAKVASAEFNVLQKNTEKMRTNFTKVGNGFKDAGKAMSVGITAPVVAFGGHAIKTALSFEESMNKVVAMTEATGEPLKNMRDLAKDLGSTTQFSASEAAEAMANLGQAGFNVNEIMDATPGLLNLAAASGADLAQSAEIAAAMIASFGLKASDSSRVADVLAQAAAASAVDITDLADSMKYAAPVAKQYGLSLEDTTAAMGLLGNVGIKGTMAGTTLKNMLLRLAAPTSKARQLFKALNIEATDSNGNMLGLTQIFKNMAPALKKLPQDKQLAFLDKVFGKEAIAGAGEFLNQTLRIGTDGKNGIERFTDAMDKSGGAAKRMADQMMAGAPGAVKELSSAFEDLELAVTDSGLLDAFTFVVLKTTDLFRWLSKTNPVILQIVSGFALLAAAVGPMLLGFGYLLTMIPNMITGFNLLTVGLNMVKVAGWGAMLPFIKFIAIAALFAFAAYKIYEAWEPIKDFFSDLFTSPLQQLKDMVGYAGHLTSAVGDWMTGNSGESIEDRRLKAQGFTIAEPAGAPTGADKVIQKSNEQQARENSARVAVDFSNLPKGAKVTSDNRDRVMTLNTGMLGGL